MQNFAEYLYYLLISPFKSHGKNQWRTLCKVLGKHCDDVKRTILDVREHTMILTCAPELLPLIGQERNMPRLRGEDVQLYRARLTHKNIIAERAGTADGIADVIKSLGYDTVYIEPAYLTNPNRWAEATCWISGGDLAIGDMEIVLQEINNVKQASALIHLIHITEETVPSDLTLHSHVASEFIRIKLTTVGG